MTLVEDVKESSDSQTPLKPEGDEEIILESGQLAILPDDWKNFVTRSDESIDPPGNDPIVPDAVQEPVIIAVVPDVVDPEPLVIAEAPPVDVAEVAEPAELTVVPLEEAEAQVAEEEPVVIAVAPPVEEPVPLVIAEVPALIEVEPDDVPVAVDPIPEKPVIPEGGPDIRLTSPLPQDYYRSSLLLEGTCLPGEGVSKQEGRIRSLS